MKRFHALEWEDLQWFPKPWRDYGTDFLQFIAVKFDIYKDVVPLIDDVLKRSGKQEFVDCASGGGGGIVNIAKTLKSNSNDLVITLTDYYPNMAAFERTKNAVPEVFQYEKDSINAMDMPARYKGTFRTMFSGFHHFRPDGAKKILQNAVDTNSPIAIFEVVGRNASSIFSMVFVILNVLLFTPFIRPVRWQVLPFIYLIPIVPLYILWDGVASILRTYSEEERREMVASLNNSDSYEWKIGKTPGAMGINYLIGYKK